MTYNEKFQYFWEHNKDLHYRSIAVYFALLTISERCKSNPFTASDKQVMRQINMTSNSTYLKAKRELIKKGFIDYNPSKVYGSGSTYTLLFTQ